MKYKLDPTIASNAQMLGALAAWGAEDILCHADYITQDPRYLHEYLRLGITFVRQGVEYVIDMDHDEPMPLWALLLDRGQALVPGKSGLSECGPPVHYFDISLRKELRDEMIRIAMHEYHAMREYHRREQ